MPLTSSRKGLARKYLLEKLGQWSTYVVALIVGSFINLYGHFLVPMFRGVEDPFSRFMEELTAHPVLTVVSVLLGYCFPFLVGTFSSVGTRLALCHFEHKADFPDQKPDPVFRVEPGGRIIDMGARTAALFAGLGLTDASEVLGGGAWEQIERGTFPQGAVLHSAPLGGDYAVSYAQGLGSFINVYMTQTAELEKGA